MKVPFVFHIALVGALVGLACGETLTEPSQQQQGAPTLSQIAPATGPVGTAVTLTGSGFTREGNTVKFGRGYIRNLPSSDGATLRFSVPEGLDLCAPNGTGPCPGGYPGVTPGEYAVAVSTPAETSNAVTFTVTGR